MSDIQPNLALRKKQMQIRVLELELNLSRMDVRKMELEAEKASIDENIAGTNKALSELKLELQK